MKQHYILLAALFTATTMSGRSSGGGGGRGGGGSTGGKSGGGGKDDGYDGSGRGGDSSSSSDDGCTSNSECRAHGAAEVCYNGACEASDGPGNMCGGKNADDVCFEGFECNDPIIENRCVPIEGTDPDQGPYDCVFDEDCERLQICYEGDCVLEDKIPTTTAGGCTSNSMCADSELCYFGECGHDYGIGNGNMCGGPHNDEACFECFECMPEEDGCKPIADCDASWCFVDEDCERGQICFENDCALPDKISGGCVMIHGDGSGCDGMAFFDCESSQSCEWSYDSADEYNQGGNDDGASYDDGSDPACSKMCMDGFECVVDIYGDESCEKMSAEQTMMVAAWDSVQSMNQSTTLLLVSAVVLTLMFAAYRCVKAFKLRKEVQSTLIAGEIEPESAYYQAVSA